MRAQSFEIWGLDNDGIDHTETRTKTLAKKTKKMYRTVICVCAFSELQKPLLLFSSHSYHLSNEQSKYFSENTKTFNTDAIIPMSSNDWKFVKHK